MGESLIVRKGGGGGAAGPTVTLFTFSQNFVAPKAGNYFIEVIGPGGDPQYISGSSPTAVGGSGSGHYESDFVTLTEGEVVPITISLATTSFGTYLSANKGSSGDESNPAANGGNGGMAGGGAAVTSFATSDASTSAGDFGGSATFGGGGGAIGAGQQANFKGGDGGTYGGGGGSSYNGAISSGGTYGGNGGNQSTEAIAGTNTTNTTTFPQMLDENVPGGDIALLIYNNWRGSGSRGTRASSYAGGGGGGFGGNGGNARYHAGGGGGGYGANGGNGSMEFYRPRGAGGGGGGFGGNGANGIFGNVIVLRGAEPQGFGSGGISITTGGKTSPYPSAVGGAGGGYGKSQPTQYGLVIVRSL
jgi:hypothetical protein